MFNLLLGLLLINGILLLAFQIISLYWREMRFGLVVFIVIYIATLFILIFGIQELISHTLLGLMFSLSYSLLGIGAFLLSFYYKKAGNETLNRLHIVIISYLILVISIVQLISTLIVLTKS